MNSHDLEKKRQAKDFLKSRIEYYSSGGVSKATACKYIAHIFKNRWGHKYLYQIAYCDVMPGPDLTRAILNIPEKTRTPQLWVKVIFDTPEQKEYALSLPMDERRRRVLKGE